MSLGICRLLPLLLFVFSLNARGDEGPASSEPVRMGISRDVLPIIPEVPREQLNKFWGLFGALSEAGLRLNQIFRIFDGIERDSPTGRSPSGRGTGGDTKTIRVDDYPHHYLRDENLRPPRAVLG